MSDQGDFYDILHDGVRLTLPRVTSILKIIDKSGPMMGWAINTTKAEIRAALEDVLTQPGELTPQGVWDRVAKAMIGQRATFRARDEAANIGRAAHAMIQWHTQRMLGQASGPEPSGPEGAERAVVAWMDWARDVNFTPLHTELLVYCPACATAGTLDAIAKVEGAVTLVDYKTGKAVYDEAHLQVCAYRHLAKRGGIAVERALILRLPKLESDPTFDPVPAVDIPYGWFRHVRGAWAWKQRMQHEPTGSVQMTKCDVEAT